MDPKNTNFRIILALTNLPNDVDLNGASLKVTLAGTTKSIPFSNKEAVPMDFSGVQSGSKLEFGVEDADGFMFGYSELKIPTTAFEKNETEVNEQLRFYLINKEKDSFTANVYTIFLNKGLFKEKAKERGSANRTRPTLNKSRSGERQDSKSPSASPSKRSPSKGKSVETKTTEKNFQAYLNRLIDTHSVQIKSLVDEHNSLNEYIHINKVQKNLPAKFAENSLETYSPTKLKTVTNVSYVNDANTSESPIGSFSQIRNIKTSNDESRNEDKSVLRELSPMVEKEKEKEKKAYNFAPEEETPAKRQDTSDVKRSENSDRSPQRIDRSPQRMNSMGMDRSPKSPSKSPSRVKAMLERKLSSEGGSPSKRKQLLVPDVINITGRKEIPDATYYSAQITQLNNVVVSQSSKIADLEIHQQENENIRQQIQKSELARKNLQETAVETSTRLQKENRELEKQISTIVSEKEQLLRKINELQDTIQNLNTNLAATKSALQEKEDINTQNGLKLVELNDAKNMIRKLQESLATTESQKARDQENYKAALARFEVSIEDAKKTIDSLNQEKRKLVLDLYQTQQELGVERAQHQMTQNELLLTKKRLENAENYKEVVASLEAQRDQLTQQLSDSRAIHAQTQHLLQESNDKLAMRQREFEQTEKNYLKDVNNLSERLAASEFKNERLSKELNEQKLKVSQLTTNVTGLEQVVVVKEDVQKQLEVTEKQLAQVLDDRKELRNKLDNVVVNHEQTNTRLIEVEKSNNQMRQILEEKEEHIEQLTSTVVALREAMETYIPTKGDPIDNAVADFINSGTDISRLKLLFIRETEGVYQFGSKRVYVKLEGGRILIRVGGGFLTIDEFIDQYAALESEKLVRIDPIKKLSQNIAVTKTLIGKCVNQMEKPKNQPYEYRSDVTNVRMLDTSQSLQRVNSREY